MSRIRSATAVLSVVALAAAACGGSSDKGKGGQAVSTVTTGQSVSLAGVCPATVVFQTDWNPEAEHGALYQLVGQGYTIDTKKKTVTGPLVAGGKDTGVKVQVRAGGPAIGFQSVPSAMYLDKSITLGMVNTDGAIQDSAKQPTTAVVSPLRKSPQMIMWDPTAHPAWKTIADIGRSGAKVVYSPGQAWADYLIAKGIVKKSELDSSYDGSPARFVTDGKTITQQGFATAEPYIYQHEVRAWMKPVAYQLIADTGLQWYPEALSVRSGDLATLGPCLKKLVPIIQQAQKDYGTNPAAANTLLIEAVQKYNNGWTYSAGVAAFAAAQMPKLGVLGDENGSLGGFTTARLQQLIDTLSPIFKANGKVLKAGLTPQDLATNEFIDPSIKFGS